VVTITEHIIQRPVKGNLLPLRRVDPRKEFHERDQIESGTMLNGKFRTQSVQRDFDRRGFTRWYEDASPERRKQLGKVGFGVVEMVDLYDVDMIEQQLQELMSNLAAALGQCQGVKNPGLSLPKSRAHEVEVSVAWYALD
jgi:hypothetical protein